MIDLDLNNFTSDPDYFGNIELLLTVKSFNLQEIRQRYLKSQKRSKSGSVKRREPAEGGLVYLKIKKGKIVRENVLLKYKEARGIDFKNNRLAISSENEIYILNIGTQEVKKIEHPWLSYIHTVKFSADLNKILVASSGVDSILEFDVATRQKIWEWNAWEAGINKGINPETGEKHYLTRSAKKANDLKSQDKKVILIQNPREDKLPTALRAAFINSAEYDSDGNILLTFFHDGDVKKLDKKSNTLTPILKGFNKPHGGISTQSGYLVTDTAGGRVIEKNDIKTNYWFKNLAGKDFRLKEMEWLQTSHKHRDAIITIDSNRTSLVVFDPDRKTKMLVPYNSNWAVQDFIDIEGNIETINKTLKSFYEK